MRCASCRTDGIGEVVSCGEVGDADIKRVLPSASRHDRVWYHYRRVALAWLVRPKSIADHAALMRDQVSSMRAKGIEAYQLNEKTDPKEIQEVRCMRLAHG